MPTSRVPIFHASNSEATCCSGAFLGAMALSLRVASPFVRRHRPAVLARPSEVARFRAVSRRIMPMHEARGWFVDGFVLVPDVALPCCFPETRTAAHGIRVAESIGLGDLLHSRQQRDVAGVDR